jgi:hypothetical protein
MMKDVNPVWPSDELAKRTITGHGFEDGNEDLIQEKR